MFMYNIFYLPLLPLEDQQIGIIESLTSYSLSLVLRVASVLQFSISHSMCD